MEVSPVHCFSIQNIVPRKSHSHTFSFKRKKLKQLNKVGRYKFYEVISRDIVRHIGAGSVFLCVAFTEVSKLNE